MFGRRGFIGMIGAALGFEVASKAAIGPSAPLALKHNPWDDPWAEILPYVTPTFPEDAAERLEVQLAGCGVAALGGTKDPAHPGQYGWSPAYQDVLALRRKFEAATRLIAERAPVGQEIALYPCGCSAQGNEIPRYCPEHGDSQHTDRCHVIHGAREEGRIYNFTNPLTHGELVGLGYKA